jgi:hypothetical protein
MSISEEAVRWAYRVLLKREVESENTVAWAVASFATLNDFCDMIMGTDEFKTKYEAGKHGAMPSFDGATIGGDATNQTVALCAIVKDEALRVEAMLRSVAGVVDFACIVDTGSSDDTVSVCERVLSEVRVPHRIAHMPFLGDFSAARNKALDMVPDDIGWSLTLDADETIAPGDGPKLRALLGVDADAWDMPRYNWLDEARSTVAPGAYPDYQRRLLRNRREKPLRYQRPVHEYVVGAIRVLQAPVNTGAGGGTLGGPHIQHHGLVGMTHERWAEKSKFYAMLEQGSGGSGA